MASEVTGDAPRPVDLDPALALERLDGWLDGATRLLPNIVTGILVAPIFRGVASPASRASSATSASPTQTTARPRARPFSRR